MIVKMAQNTADDSADKYFYSSWTEYYKLLAKLPQKCPFCKESLKEKDTVGAHVWAYKKIPYSFEPELSITACCNYCNLLLRNSTKLWFLNNQFTAVPHPSLLAAEDTACAYRELKDILTQRDKE